jgi:hypothetical protein
VRVITIDSQVLNTIQACFRKTQYSFIYNLTPFDKAEALEKGDLMHKILEVYYSMRGPKDYTTPVWQELIEAGISPYRDPVSTAIRAGEYFSTKLQISLEICEEVIKHFKDYAEYYEHDEWVPLAVEEVGSKTMYEDQDIKIIYSFKIDLVMEKGHIICPFDHKTGKQRHDPLSLSNQFIGYCYALSRNGPNHSGPPCNNILMNKIGFQKTLSPAERFQRFSFTIDDSRIDEWVRNTIWWVKLYAECIETDEYPMNLTSCDKYSGCIFKRICESDPSSRDYKITRDFSSIQKWDVAKTLGVEV